MSIQAHIIQSIEAITAQMRPSVVSIGNFDGVHRGHQSVVKQLLERSQALNLPAVVVTFDPLAKEYFSRLRQDLALPARLTSIEHRAQLLAHYGVDHVIALPFDKQLSEQQAQLFVQELLVEGLQARHLVVGDDFRFGFQRQGDFELLQKMGQSYGFDVASMATFRLDGQRVSSGRVREALANDDFVLTQRLLGRHYSIAGCVVKGDQIGRTIGFPTANIQLPDAKLPLHGVFAVMVQLPDGKHCQGVANIGNRPTVNGKENRLEVHLLDLSADVFFDTTAKDRQNTFESARQVPESEASYELYGLDLEVFFMHRIRHEVKFDNMVQLQTQIHQDIGAAKRFFAGKR